jgi:hypothetical protein
VYSASGRVSVYESQSGAVRTNSGEGEQGCVYVYGGMHTVAHMDQFEWLARKRRCTNDCSRKASTLRVVPLAPT